MPKRAVWVSRRTENLASEQRVGVGRKRGKHVMRWERLFKQSSNIGMRTNEFELALSLET